MGSSWSSVELAKESSQEDRAQAVNPADVVLKPDGARRRRDGGKDSALVQASPLGDHPEDPDEPEEPGEGEEDVQDEEACHSTTGDPAPPSVHFDETVPSPTRTQSVRRSDSVLDDDGSEQAMVLTLLPGVDVALDFPEFFTPSGLVWTSVGNARPESGSRLKNQLLANALREKAEFTEKEWAAFGVDGLHSEHFVEVDGHFYQPQQQRSITANRARLTRSSTVNQYRLVGPKDKVRALQEGGIPKEDLRGIISPCQPVTIHSQRARKRVGIPRDAVKFAFVYPASAPDVDNKLENLYLGHRQHQQWAYLLLLGGFCYFDEEDNLLSVSALTPFESPHSLYLTGPIPASLGALCEMTAQKRMMHTTFSPLIAAGYVAFGWVHRNECPGGHALGPKAYEHGAYVYETSKGDAVYYRLATANPLKGHLNRVQSERSVTEREESEQSWRWEQVDGEYHRVSNIAEAIEVARRFACFDWARACEKLRRLQKRSRVRRMEEDKRVRDLGLDRIDLFKDVPMLPKALRPYLLHPMCLGLMTPVTFAAVVLSIAVNLMFIAYWSRDDWMRGGTFRICATFTFFCLFAWMIFQPLRTTSAVLVARKAQMSSLKKLVWIVPFVTTGLDTANRLITYDHGVDRWQRNLAAVIATFILSVAVPLLLLWLSKRHVDSVVSNDNLLVFPIEKRRMLSSVQGLHKRIVGTMKQAAASPVLKTFKRGAPPPASRANPSVALTTEGKDELSKGLSAKGAVKAAQVQEPSCRCTDAQACSSSAHASGSTDAAGQHVIEMSDSLGEYDDQEKRVRLAIWVQTRFRGRLSRMRFHKEQLAQQDRLTSFAWPMFITTIINLLGNAVVDKVAAVQRWDVIHGPWARFYNLWWLLMLVPCLFVLFVIDPQSGRTLVDVTTGESTSRTARCLPSKRPQFSVAHVIFFAQVLYTSTYRTSSFTPWLYYRIRDVLKSCGLEVFDSAVGISIHVSLMSSLLVIGKRTLSYVTVPNTRSFFLFPFQFFDFTFAYVFFGLRNLEKAVAPSWILQQVLLQGVLFMRNSGITAGLATILAAKAGAYLRGASYRLVKVRHVWKHRCLRWSRRMRMIPVTGGSSGSIPTEGSASGGAAAEGSASGYGGESSASQFRPSSPPRLNSHAHSSVSTNSSEGATPTSHGTSCSPSSPRAKKKREASQKRLQTMRNRALRDARSVRTDPTTDPVFRLNFISALAVQYDIADACAVCFVPVLVRAFVARDGFFTLQGTGVLVRACMLGNLLQRVLIQLACKYCASYLARLWLLRTMGKTLLGWSTIHGVSRLTAKVNCGRVVVSKDQVSTKELVRREMDSALAPLRTQMPKQEYDMVVEELSLDNMNYQVLFRRKIMKNGWFYACVMLYILFAAFPVIRRAPTDDLKHWFADYISNANAPNGSLALTVGSTPINELYRAQMGWRHSGEEVTSHEVFTVPPYMAWEYVHPVLLYALDPWLRDAFKNSIDPTVPADAADDIDGGCGVDIHMGLHE